MQLFARAALRTASVASRSFLSTPKSSTRFLSTRSLRPSHPLVSSFAFQRRFNTEDAKKVEEEDDVPKEEENLVGEEAESVESSTIAAEASTEAIEGVSQHNAEISGDTATEASQQPTSLTKGVRGSNLGWTIEPSNTIYIGNVFFDAKEEDIREFFSKYGTITKIDLITDIRGYSKGFAFIQFSSKNDAARAVQDAHGKLFAGRRLAANFSVQRDPVKRDPNPPSKTLFIGNLSYEITDKELNDLFRPLRNIRDVRVAIDRRTGQPRGFAHADFTDTESAIAGKAELDGREIRGRLLKTDFSSSRRDQPDAAQNSS